MNFRKIATMLIILCVLSFALSAVSADSSKQTNMGNISSSDIKINGITPIPQFTSGVSTGPSMSRETVDFTAKIHVDISKMNDSDKELLTKAVDDDNTTVTLKITDGHDISIELRNGTDMSIDEDTLNIEISNSYDIPNSSKNVTLNSVEIKTGDNHLFTANKTQTD